MPDGTTMVGPIHGPGQVCIQWARGSSRLHKNIHNYSSEKKIKASIKSKEMLEAFGKFIDRLNELGDELKVRGL